MTVSGSFLLQAVEAAQLAEDLKVQLEHTQAKLKEIQVSVAENRTARERESSNLKRALVRRTSVDPAPKSQIRNTVKLLCFALQEDLSRLRRKLEKQKKVEVYSDADEILQEEINQYKVSREVHSLVRSKGTRQVGFPWRYACIY